MAKFIAAGMTREDAISAFVKARQPGDPTAPIDRGFNRPALFPYLGRFRCGGRGVAAVRLRRHALATVLALPVDDPVLSARLNDEPGRPRLVPPAAGTRGVPAVAFLHPRLAIAATVAVDPWQTTPGSVLISPAIGAAGGPLQRLPHARAACGGRSVSSR